MALRRIKDRWHNSTPDDTHRNPVSEKTLQDQASALAYIIWRQALNGAINLHAEDFRYDSDQQRIAVISELLAFQIQHADRLAHQFLRDPDRQTLLVDVCQATADQMQDNLTDIAGPGNYRPPYLKLLNQRFESYAEFSYRGAEPAYPALVFLGQQVLSIMGDDQTNRWVIEQITEIDAPALADQVEKSLHRLFDTT